MVLQVAWVEFEADISAMVAEHCTWGKITLFAKQKGFYRAVSDQRFGALPSR
jgi:hypothetical protein